MQLSNSIRVRLEGMFTVLKEPATSGHLTQQDPAVARRVSGILEDIEANGIDAVLRYARELDGWEDDNVELDESELKTQADRLEATHRAALDLGAERTRLFAQAQRDHLVDFETEFAPGLVVGQRYVPVAGVGSYLPAGRFPLTASAFMTVNVAKTAGVGTVLACTPPSRGGSVDPAICYSALISGADRVFALGGVQALAAMAFGLLDENPVDMLVGAGNAYVVEAKRQLFGRVAIDLLAGPSEVAVIADGSADPSLIAADLLGQAEHGPDSPAGLVTTSEPLAWAVMDEVTRQLGTLATAEIAGAAWRDRGMVLVARDHEVAAQLMDDLAPEHLEIQTEDDDAVLALLHNYGSVFLGPWSTVAYSDKGMAGTNHVLPTAGGARHSAGLSVSRFLKPLTWQRVTREATPALASAVEVMSTYEGMAAHRATATMRLASYRG